MAKELFIMRHAKAAPQSKDADFERPLRKRGVNASKRIGDSLNRLGWSPESILVSPAIRAKQTLKALGLTAASVTEDKRIYNADLSSLFDALADVDDSVDKLMLIGHNPSLEALLLHLAPAAERQKNGKLLTTANVARIGIVGSWSNLNTKKGKLLGLIRPKEMED